MRTRRSGGGFLTPWLCHWIGASTLDLAKLRDRREFAMRFPQSSQALAPGKRRALNLPGQEEQEVHGRG